MRKVIFCLAICAGSISCKKEEAIPAPTVEKEIVLETPGIHECYTGIMKNDTVKISLTTKGADVTEGKLSYHFFEKDKNEGTFTGRTSGDTLFGDYTFQSEGKQSVREVVFLKKGNIYIEGYGDVEEKDGKTCFKNRKKLFFDSKTVLTKTACD